MADGLNVPVQEMDRWLREIRGLEPAIAQDAITVAAEAVVSEAQTNANDFINPTGTLQNAHGVTDYRNGKITLFANTSYALARHEVFPDKPGHQWFTRAIVEHAPRILEGSMKFALRRAGAQSS